MTTCGTESRLCRRRSEKWSRLPRNTGRPRIQRTYITNSVSNTGTPRMRIGARTATGFTTVYLLTIASAPSMRPTKRSEEHTSELQSHHDLVCRLLLEKKKKKSKINTEMTTI